jgi:hypothetical protein
MPGSLPWLSGPCNYVPGGNNDLDRYLEEAATLITTRVRALADDACQQQPAWTSLLGRPPASSIAREQWRHHLGVIAAYRDQYQIAVDDPRQILGPYAEPGHAGHATYWHAAESVLAARHLAGLEPAAATSARPGICNVTCQVIADIYLGLPDTERTAVSAGIREALGPLWFGDRFRADDHVVTQPAYAARLATALIERGHLSPAPRQARDRATATPLEAALVQRRATPRPARQSPSAETRHERSGLHRAHDAPVQPSPPAETQRLGLQQRDMQKSATRRPAP